MATRNEIELLIKARDEASKALDDVTKKIQGLDGAASPASASLAAVEKSAGGVGQRVLEMAAGFFTAEAAMKGLQRASDLLIGSFEKGIASTDMLRMAQAAMAGAAATNDPSIGFQKAYDIAGKMVDRVQLLSATFVGTGDELAQLAQAMVTFGLGLDLSTDKAQKNFVSFANMFKIMTAGQEFSRQAMSEIRALAQGQEVAGAMVIRYLEAAGINVKQMLPIWKEQGTLLENIMQVMSGYDQATGKIANTLQTQKTTLETISLKILREGTAGAYQDILELVKRINGSLMDQNGLTERGRKIVDLMQLGWDAVKTAAGGIYDVFSWIDDRLSSIVTKWSKIIQESGNYVPPIEGAIGTVTGEDLDAQARAQGKSTVSGKISSILKPNPDTGLKLPPSASQITDAELKAAEQVAKKIEALYDKIAIEAARKRGGDMEAELEKARIDYINRNRDLIELQEKGKVPADERAEQLRVSTMEYEAEREKIITKAEERIAAEVDKIRKHVDSEEEKARQKRLHDIAKSAEQELELLIKQEEKAAEILEKYAEMQRYYSERAPRPWDKPGEKDRQKALHDFQTEKNALEALRRKGEQGMAGGISAEQYDQAMEALVAVHKERLGQIEDATDEATNRQAKLWEEMFSGMNATFSDVFFDAFSGKLKTMSDYFEAALNVMRRAWANFLSDMMTKQLEAQFQGVGGISGFLSKLFGAGGGSTGWAGTAENSALAMDVEHLGMYGLAEGGIVPHGLLPIRAFSAGGITNGPTLAALGGGSLDPGGGAEAVIPLKGGKVPVDIRGNRGGGDLNINFQIAAIDSRSVRQMLIEERGTLSGLIRNEIVNAGYMRDAVRSR